MTNLDAVLFIIVLIFIFWCVQSERRTDPDYENEELVQARIDHLDAMTESQEIENANELFKSGWLTKKAIDGLMLSFSYEGEQLHDELSPVIDELVLMPEKAA